MATGRDNKNAFKMPRKVSKIRKEKDTEITSQSTQSNRKLMRNILKARVGSNKIRSMWNRAQITRYGEKALQIIHSKNLTLRQRRAKSALFR